MNQDQTTQEIQKLTKRIDELLSEREQMLSSLEVIKGLVSFVSDGIKSGTKSGGLLIPLRKIEYHVRMWTDPYLRYSSVKTIAEAQCK